MLSGACLIWFPSIQLFDNLVNLRAGYAKRRIKEHKQECGLCLLTIIQINFSF